MPEDNPRPRPPRTPPSPFAAIPEGRLVNAVVIANFDWPQVSLDPPYAETGERAGLIKGARVTAKRVRAPMGALAWLVRASNGRVLLLDDLAFASYFSIEVARGGGRR